ncbi:MAG: isopeptide-forming domain-containing fimbrial protein, partial [Defluviitaleaceae bacterium]|nr:isopeptide-forming domain-containing fimbrial protein [Defluviitaleaceae bacterium]
PTLDKDGDVRQQLVGGYINYTLKVTNPNPYAALYNFDVVDVLDLTLVELVDGPSMGTFNPATGEIRANIERLAPNSSIEITFRVRVLAGAADGNIPNTALLIYVPTGEQVDEDDHDVDVPDLLDPTLDKDGDVTRQYVGRYINYTLSVTNPNPYAALYNFDVVDVLDLTLVELVDGPSMGAFNPVTGEIRANIERLAPNSSIEITFRVRVLAEAADGNIPNTALLIYVPTGEQVDEDDHNVDVPPLDPPTLEKSADVAFQEVGGEVTYTITVNNPNDVVLPGAFDVVDVLDLSLVAFIPGSVQINGSPASTGWDYTFNGLTGELRVTFDSLAVGDTAITFRVEVLPAAEGSDIPNVAILETPEEEIPSEEVIVRVPQLSLIKRVNGQNEIVAQVGDTLIYTIEVNNESPFDVFGYQVVDDLNHLLAYIDVIPQSISVNTVHATAAFIEGLLIVDFDQLYANETVTITFRATVLEAAAGRSDLQNVAFLYSLIIDEDNNIERDPAGQPTRGSQIDDDDAIVHVSDLTLIKWVNGSDEALVNVGETLMYTITVRNNSAFSVVNHRVVDDLNHLFAYIDVHANSVLVNGVSLPGAMSNGVLTVNIAYLAPGNTYTITFTATVLAEAPGDTFVNVAVLYDEDDRPVDEDDAAVQVPKLSLVKHVNGVDLWTAYVDEVLTYSIYVTNESPFNVFDHEVVDDLTHLLTYIAVDANSIVVESHYPASHAFTNGVLTVNFPQLVADEVAVITFNATVLEAAAGRIDLVNVAHLYGPPTDGNGGLLDPEGITPEGRRRLDYDDATIQTPVLTLEKVVNGVDDVIAEAGEVLTYTITVTNESEFSAFNHRVVDDLNPLLAYLQVDPESITVTSNNDATVTFANGVLTVHFAELDAGEVATIEFDATVLEAAEGRVLVNVAVLYGPPGEEEDDEVPIDEDEADVLVPGLSVEKLVNGETSVFATVGETLTYTIAVTNYGPVHVLDHVLIDDLSHLAAYLDIDTTSLVISRDQVAYAFEGHVLTVHFPELASQEVVLITFTATVLASAEGTAFINTAVLYGPPSEETGERPVVDEDDATVEVPLVSLGKLVNGVDSTIASVGDILNYTITVTNESPFDVFDYQVVDDLRHLLSLIGVDANSIAVESNSAAVATFVNGILTVDFSELAAFEAATITFRVRVLEAAEGTIFANVAALYGPLDEAGERPFIEEDDATVEVPEVPGPTTPTDPTQPPTLPPTDPTDPTEPPTDPTDPTEIVTTQPTEPIVTTAPPTVVLPPTEPPTVPTTKPVALPTTGLNVAGTAAPGIVATGIGTILSFFRRKKK